jgi:hypothetical protein
LTFESGSRLSILGRSVFRDCSSLESICLPPNVRQFSGATLSDSYLKNVTIDPGNEFLRVAGDFLIDLSDSCTICYFGHEGNVRLFGAIESIPGGRFKASDSGSRSGVRLGSDWQIISSLGESAFENCLFLRSIYISSSIETIRQSCFRGCDNLSILIFEPGSKLSALSKSTFEGCSSLRSICIPSSIEVISDYCFYNCENLSDLRFESGSKISVLGDSAFEKCSSLLSVCIPSSIQTISRSCFRNCGNFSGPVLETDL